MKFKKVSQKVDFSKLERQILEYWDKHHILAKYLTKNQKAEKKFRFLDGPITANGPMGVHHAWGRTYKDLWQRFYNMMGYQQRFQNGFDNQGLWVEVSVEKELGFKNKKDIEDFGIANFVNKCKERTLHFAKVLTEHSRRLGYFMDWDHSYYTLSDENNYAIWHYLKTIHEKGWLYKGRDSVPWCPRCGTAISQHEILTEEYQELTHKAVYLKYPIVGRENEYLLVWTTTPWTLLSNVAVAVNPDLEYQGLEVGGDVLWFAADTYERLKKILLGVNLSGKVAKGKLSSKVGREIVGWFYEGPYDDLPAVKKAKEVKPSTFHKIVPSQDLVTAEEGTGLVHIAPGAGEEDFDLAQKENLAVIASIDESANYLEGFGKFTGKNAKDDPNLVLNDLKSKGFVFKIENYTHRYPICWRCKTELVWRVVDEWYIAMDRQDPQTGKTYRELMKQVIKDISWIPKWGYERELDWLNNMADWLISKKRYWGLALPIWECQKCKNFEVIGSKEELKNETVSGWDKFEGNSPHRPWVDEIKIKCSKCGEVIGRVADVGNPWLDAGIVPFSTLKYFEDRNFWREWFPADFVTESFPGQFKNWFYSLIAMSTGLVNLAPLKNLLGHGLVRDEKGEEMHKSKGNAIEFDEAAEKIGVDVMRWLYLRTKPENNVNFGYHQADEIRRLYFLRLWNVYLFLTTYAKIDQWSPSQKQFTSTQVLDRWIVSRFNNCLAQVTKALDGLTTKRFDAAQAAADAESFIDDLSNWYVRRIRDRVGPTAEDGQDKNDAYQTLWLVLVQFSQLLAPIVPFVSEEIYRNLTGEESVHLAPWPKVNNKLIDNSLEKEMVLAREIVEAAHSRRKVVGLKVRQPLASLVYQASQKLSGEVEKVIAAEINVKRVEFGKKSSIVKITLGTEITDQLKKEGQARDLVRQIQELRKKESLPLAAKIVVLAPSWPSEFEEVIKNQTLSSKIVKAKKLEIKRVD